MSQQTSQSHVTEHVTVSESRKDPIAEAEKSGTRSGANLRTLAESNALLALLIVIGAFFAVLPRSRGVFL